MFKNYFTVALRNLLRNKIYAFINIAGLSIGLACAMLIILYVKDEVSYDRFHANVNQIYRIVTQGIDKNGGKREQRSQQRLFTRTTICAKCSRDKIFCSRTKRK